MTERDYINLKGANVIMVNKDELLRLLREENASLRAQLDASIAMECSGCDELMDINTKLHMELDAALAEPSEDEAQEDIAFKEQMKKCSEDIYFVGGKPAHIAEIRRLRSELAKIEAPLDEEVILTVAEVIFATARLKDGLHDKARSRKIEFLNCMEIAKAAITAFLQNRRR